MSAATSAVDELRALPAELKLAGGAAIALVVTLLLPWYEKNFVAGDGRLRTESFRSLSPVEAALLLVAAGVLFLVWSRAQRKGFHLPGGDGTVIAAGGGWCLVLIVYRMFDQPDVTGLGASVGLRWGIFVAALAAGALVLAGARVRAVDRPEPPNPAERPTSTSTPAVPSDPGREPFAPPKDRLF